MKDAPHIGGALGPQRAPQPVGTDSSERSSAELDRMLAAIAGRQHGMVGRRQLMEAGLTRDMVKRRLARGLLHPVHRGVYGVGHAVTTVEGRWMAAVLAFAPDAVLSHRSAGQLWGLLPRSRIPPEVTRSRHARGRPHLVVHQSSVPTDEVGRVLGIPVTSVPRTLFDLAATRPEREVERAWNEAEFLGLTDPLSVPDLLERHPGRPGSLLLTRLASGKTRFVGRTRSELEEAFLALVDRSGLPRPRMNAHLPLRGRFFEVDCLWEDRKVAIELDGGAAHRTTKAFHKDRERDRILTAERWTTTRVTWEHIEETPAELVDDLRLILTPYP